MLMSLFLVTLLTQGLAQGAQAQSPSPAFDTAVQLAAEGREAEALAAFQRLAAVNPNDHRARLWIARLHDRMGRPNLAEAVYRSVALEDGTNVDALLGLGMALIELDQAEDAISTLERAEVLAPQNAGVQAGLGRAHAVAGHGALAVEYLRRAATIDPTDANVMAYERTDLAHRHRAHVQYAHETFSDSTANASAGELGLNVRLRDDLRVLGRAQSQNKFTFREWRAGGGVAWTWKGSTTLTAQALAGSDNVVMPERDYLGEIAYTYHQRGAALSVRYFDFNAVTMTVISPSAEWWPIDRLRLGARYAVSITERPAVTPREIGHTVHLRASYQALPRLWVNLGAARGVEDFDNLSIDRVGKVVATTGSAGVRIDRRTLTSVHARYEYLRPHAGRTMGRATVSVTQGF